MWVRGDKMKIKQLIICTCIGAFTPIYNLVAADTNINIQELGMFASPNELNSQLGPIKERIYNYDPTFSQQLESMPEENQLIAVRTWLAEKSFDFYYDEYMRCARERNDERISKERSGSCEKWEKYGKITLRCNFELYVVPTYKRADYLEKTADK